MSLLVRTFVQLCLLATLVQLVCVGASDTFEMDGNLEELFFGEQILPVSYENSDVNELLRRSARQADGSPGEFATFQFTLSGDLTIAQRTTGNQANTELKAELETRLKTDFDAAVTGVTFTVTIDSTTDTTTNRRKRQTGTSATLQVAGTIAYENGTPQTFTGLASALVQYETNGLVIFPNQNGQLSLNVESTQIASQNDPLKGAPCYLCEDYETCVESSSGSWSCNFQNDEFYPFGTTQGDSTLDKTAEQTSARLSITEDMPYMNNLYDTIWFSLYGTISFGRNEFNSVAIQNLPVSGSNVIAPYWSHWIQSAQGEVYFKRYLKRSTNTDAEKGVFQRAINDVSQYAFKDNFDPTIVIVITWVRVLHYHTESNKERASFQATLISDGSETYLAYLYGSKALKVQQRAGQRISVGWGTSTNAVLDTQTNYYRFDSVSGDTGKPGNWFFKIGEMQNPRAKCINWFNENAPNIGIINLRNRLGIPRGCPCSRQLAIRRPWWIKVQGRNCWDLAPRRNIEWGRRCCYFGDILDNMIPFAGSYQAITPFGGNYQGHVLEDVVPKRWCCQQSSLCNLYYIVRPRAFCARSQATRSFQWGDPHMVTADGKSFTFNNLGEFTLITVKGLVQNVTVDLTAQARTCQATNVNGTATDATVWCAFAMLTTQKSTVQVSITKDENGTSDIMLIFANGRDYTVAFRDMTVDFQEQNKDVFLSRDSSGTLQMTTQDGISFGVSLASGILEFNIDIESSLAGLTTGLMGNYNTNTTDDFMYPNGTLLDTDASDRQIFEYVQTWAITADNTVFTYDNGKGPADFANASFVPLFLDEVDNATLAAAAKVCGGTSNSACLFDFVATQNEELARRSQTAQEDFNKEKQEDESSAPEVEGPETFNVTVGTPVTVAFNVSHADNQNVTVTLQQQSNQVTLRETSSSTVEIDYTPVSDVSLITSPTLVVVDQANLTTVTAIGIVQCSGCKDRGDCDFVNPRQVISPYISVAACICQSPYTGNDCEADKNGCDNLPCPLLTNCTDVPAAEELATGKAFTCSECPTGYRNDTGGQCADIDECQGAGPCPSDATCQNTIGSFTCTCNTGYRKDATGNCQDMNECVELRNNCEQLCINVPGEYQCDCLAGYSLDIMGFNCTKDIVDPCAASQINCTYHCDIVNNTAQCVCGQGFKLAADGTTCEDVNECDLNICSQTCTNTVGSYVCSCLPGYKKSAEDNQECVVCDENKYGTNCASTCECKGRSTGCDKVRGCLCTSGWTGTTCDTDVNECLLTANLCPQTQQCVNTNGSYVCACPVGYVVNGSACDDIDECADPLVSSCPQLCTNSPGSFFCNCRAGFNYNITTKLCDDIDECATGVAGCEQDCVNVEGSYTCQCRLGFVLNDDRKTCRKDPTTDPCAGSSLSCGFGCTLVNGTQQCFCKKGFKLDTDAATCIDVDECMDKSLNLCSDICTNTQGSYDCGCPAGKKLKNDQRTCEACDGFHWGDGCAKQCDCNPLGTRKCDSVSGCQCMNGWNGTTCYEDVPECASDPCPANSNCTETPGSYLCTCDTGFRLLEEPVGNKTCVDIDECNAGNRICDQTCTNSIGSFVCSCASGFLLENLTKCIDVDECADNTTHKCEQTCRNLAGGFQCECRPGYTLNVVDRKSCLDIDECAFNRDHTCSNLELCSNSIGSFACSCKPGYETINDSCIASTAGNSSILTFSIRLDIPGANAAILNSTTQAFRAMEEKVSRQVLSVGQGAVGNALLSVVVDNFTQGSFIANTQLAVSAADNSESQASLGASIASALRTADMTPVAPGASVLDVTVGAYSLSNSSELCDVFNTLHQCVSGSACNDTSGTAMCVVVPTQAPTTQAPTTAPPESDTDNTDLIIGLSVGIPLFILLIVVIAIVVYVCSKRKPGRHGDQSSVASGPRSIQSGVITRWKPDRRFPYSPDSFRTSDSSDVDSTTSGPTHGRSVFPKDKPGTDPFESPFMGQVGAAPATPKPHRADAAERAAAPNTNSNFSWDNMFNLLEPHVPLEMPRPQLKQPQSPDRGSGEGSGEGSGGHSSGEA